MTLGSKKALKNEPCLGSFLAVGGQNLTKPICFLESSAPLYYQKKNLRGIFFSKKKS